MGGVFWFGMSLFTRQAWIWNEKSQIGSTSLSHLEARFPAHRRSGRRLMMPLKRLWSEIDQSSHEPIHSGKSDFKTLYGSL